MLVRCKNQHTCSQVMDTKAINGPIMRRFGVAGCFGSFSDAGNLQKLSRKLPIAHWLLLQSTQDVKAPVQFSCDNGRGDFFPYICMELTLFTLIVVSSSESESKSPRNTYDFVVWGGGRNWLSARERQPNMQERKTSTGLLLQVLEM